MSQSVSRFFFGGSFLLRCPLSPLSPLSLLLLRLLLPLSRLRDRLLRRLFSRLRDRLRDLLLEPPSSFDLCFNAALFRISFILSLMVCCASMSAILKVRKS